MRIASEQWTPESERPYKCPACGSPLTADQMLLADEGCPECGWPDFEQVTR